MSPFKPNVVQKDISVKVVQKIGFIKIGELNTGFFGMSQQAAIKRRLQLKHICVVSRERFRNIQAETFASIQIEAWS